MKIWLYGLDIGLFALIAYYVYVSIRNTQAIQLIKGILVLFALNMFAQDPRALDCWSNTRWSHHRVDCRDPCDFSAGAQASPAQVRRQPSPARACRRWYLRGCFGDC